MSINKAVLYVFLACALTSGAMIWIARRMQDKPNRVQTLVEGAYDLTYTQIAQGNMPSETAAKYFPFVATLFFFIWFSNMLGYIPLPTNTQETIDIFGIAFPAFGLYAATANLSVPLVLTLRRSWRLPGRGHPPPRPPRVPQGLAARRRRAGSRRDRSS